MNFDLRDQILQPYVVNGSTKGGITRFKGLPFNMLEELIFKGFVRLGSWNSCGGVEDLFLPFLMRHPDFTAHGYAVSKERPDFGIVIEGIECSSPLAIQTVVDFANTFRRADDFDLSLSHARCWYD